MSALKRACIRRAKEILARRALRQGECGRHGKKERRLTWGDLVVFPAMVFMPQGRRAGFTQAFRSLPYSLRGPERGAREKPKGVSLDAKRGHKEGAKRSKSR